MLDPAAAPRKGLMSVSQQQEHRVFRDESLKRFLDFVNSEQWKNSKNEWKIEANATTAQLAGSQFWVLHGEAVMVKTSLNKKCVFITYSTHLKVAIAIMPYPLFSFKAPAAENK